jgi:DNA-binding response OmpR family regulator
MERSTSQRPPDPRQRILSMIAPGDSPFAHPPRVVLAHADSAYAALSCRYFRRQGMQVNLASSAAEARRLVRKLAPKVLVLDTSLRDESGWLTCAKVIAEDCDQRVVLVAPEASSENQALADFVGASALVPRGAGPGTLVEEVLGGTLAAAV